MGNTKLLIFLAALFGASSVTAATANELDRIVAVVEEDVIMESELEEQLQRARRPAPGGTEMPPTTVLERQCGTLGAGEDQLQVADQAGVEIEESVIDQAVEDMPAATTSRSTSSARSSPPRVMSSRPFANRSSRIIIAKLRREKDNRVRVTDNRSRQLPPERAGRRRGDRVPAVAHPHRDPDRRR